MRLISLLILSILFFGCKKDEPQTNVVSQLDNGVVVLCEGLFQQNNSTISWVDLGTSQVTNQFFYQKANRSLGDTGNDMIRYGSKVYVIVNVSSTIEVLNASTFEPIKQINMMDGNNAKQPRYFQPYGSKIYVSCYDGFVDVLDTATLTVTQRIQVGPNPEGMAISNGKLFVANSGGLNFPDPDSTLSVIDLATNLELEKIMVGLNPGDVIADNQGDIYVVSRGDYSSIPSRLVRVNANSNTLTETFSFDASSIYEGPEGLLILYVDQISGSNQLSSFNTTTEAISSGSVLDMTTVTTPYSIFYDQGNNCYWVSDAMGYTNSGYLKKYDLTGTLLTSYHVGLNPSKIVVYE